MLIMNSNTLDMLYILPIPLSGKNSASRSIPYNVRNLQPSVTTFQQILWWQATKSWNEIETFQKIIYMME